MIPDLSKDEISLSSKARRKRLELQNNSAAFHCADTHMHTAQLERRSAEMIFALAATGDQLLGLPGALRGIHASNRHPEKLQVFVFCKAAHAVAVRKFLQCEGVLAGVRVACIDRRIENQLMSVHGLLKASDRGRRRAVRLMSPGNYVRFFLHQLLPQATRVVWVDVDVMLVAAVEVGASSTVLGVKCFIGWSEALIDAIAR